MECNGSSFILGKTNCKQSPVADKILGYLLFFDAQNLLFSQMTAQGLSDLYKNDNFAGFWTGIAQADNANVAPVMEDLAGYGVSTQIQGAEAVDNYTFVGDICTQKNNANIMKGGGFKGYAFALDESGMIVGWKSETPNSMDAFPLNIRSNTPTGLEKNGQGTPKDVMQVSRGWHDEFVLNREFYNAGIRKGKIKLPIVVDLTGNATTINVFDSCTGEAVDLEGIENTEIAIIPYVNGLMKSATATTVAGNTISYSITPAVNPTDTISVKLTVSQGTDVKLISDGAVKIK